MTAIKYLEFILKNDKISCKNIKLYKEHIAIIEYIHWVSESE
jgi:hypothetical protein